MDNSNYNAEAAVELLVILMMVSSLSSISSSFGAIALQRKADEIRLGDQDALNAIDNINQNLQTELAGLNVDAEEMRALIEEAYSRACVITPTGDSCPADMHVEAGCCAFDDPARQSTFSKTMNIVSDVVRELLIVYMFEKAVVAMYRAGVAVNTRIGGQAAAATGRALSTKAATRAVATVAGKTAGKAATKGAAKMALKTFGKASMKLVGGPLGVVLIVVEVISLVLDIMDPMGYQTFQPNEVMRNMRNKIDVDTEKALTEGEMSENQDYPMTFPLAFAFPEYEEEYSTKLFEKFLPKALELMDGDMVVEFFVTVLGSESEDAEIPDTIQNAIDDSFELALAKHHLERDQFIYDFYSGKGLADQIELVPFMSTAKRIGVTLSQHGANLYNTRMKEQHMLYSNPYEVADETTIPDDYVPFVACYTDKYRTLDKSNPGTGERPNVVEHTLQQKCVLANPYAVIVVSCSIGMKATGGARVDPEEYGVTFNQQTGYCDYTAEYCSRMALKTEDNDCGFYPGQKYAEMIFGTTLTRTVVSVANNADDTFIGIGDSVAYVVTHPEEVVEELGDVAQGAPDTVAGAAESVASVVADPVNTGNEIADVFTEDIPAGLTGLGNAIGSFFSSF